MSQIQAWILIVIGIAITYEVSEIKQVLKKALDELSAVSLCVEESRSALIAISGDTLAIRRRNEGN